MKAMGIENTIIIKEVDLSGVDIKMIKINKVIYNVYDLVNDL